MSEAGPILFIVGFAALFFFLGVVAGRETLASRICGEADHSVEGSAVYCKTESGYEEVIW